MISTPDTKTKPFRMAINSANIDLSNLVVLRDYGKRGHKVSPYAITYQDLSSQQCLTSIGTTPMVDSYGQKIEARWTEKNGTFITGNNIFRATVTGLDTRVVALSDQPSGMKTGDAITSHPQLFLSGAEVKPQSVKPKLLLVDPTNENYPENTLEWDYGVCKRRMRIIEGQFSGSWVFEVAPPGEIRIKYNQVGFFKLRLGLFQVSVDEEIIPVKAFDNPIDGWPFTVQDSATFYTDQVNTVSGRARYNAGNVTWAVAWNHAGSDADLNAIHGFILNGTILNNYTYFARSPVPFDSSALPDDCTINAGTFSLYGTNKMDTNGTTPGIGVCYCNQTNVNNVVAGDYSIARWGGTRLAPDIAFNDWVVGDYNVYTLNADGLANISKTSYSKFGCRLSYDIDNIQPAWNGAGLYQGIYAAVSGAGQQPRLIVTYTPAAATGPYPIVGGYHIIRTEGGDV